MLSCKNQVLSSDLKIGSEVSEPDLIRQGVPEPRGPDRESPVTLSSQPWIIGSQELLNAYGSQPMMSFKRD